MLFNHFAFNSIGNDNLYSICSNKDARTIHCSNTPIGFQDWPNCTPLGFGNSPPETPMAKVSGGVRKFEEIIKQTNDKDRLVENLMEMLSCRDKYVIIFFYHFSRVTNGNDL